MYSIPFLVSTSSWQECCLLQEEVRPVSTTDLSTSLQVPWKGCSQGKLRGRGGLAPSEIWRHWDLPQKDEFPAPHSLLVCLGSWFQHFKVLHKGRWRTGHMNWHLWHVTVRNFLGRTVKLNLASWVWPEWPYVLCPLIDSRRISSC